MNKHTELKERLLEVAKEYCSGVEATEEEINSILEDVDSFAFCLRHKLKIITG